MFAQNGTCRLFRKHKQDKLANFFSRMWPVSTSIVVGILVWLASSFLTMEEPQRRCEGVGRRIVAIGDIHGDYGALTEVLEAAGVSKDCEWIGDETLVVQMGDIVDRGLDADKANACLARLQEKGSVVRLTGNHELMQAAGDYRYTSEPPAVIQANVRRWRDDVLAGRVQGAFAIGPYLFSHAGFRPAMIDEIDETSAEKLAERVNTALRDAVAKCSENTCAFAGPLFSAGPDRGGRGIGGPFWTDFSVLSTARGLPKDLIQVVGHSPPRCKAWKSSSCEPIRSRPDLGAIVVDAGLSKAYASNRAFLEILTNGRLLSHALGPSNWKVSELTSCSSSQEEV